MYISKEDKFLIRIQYVLIGLIILSWISFIYYGLIDKTYSFLVVSIPSIVLNAFIGVSTRFEPDEDYRDSYRKSQIEDFKGVLKKRRNTIDRKINQLETIVRMSALLSVVVIIAIGLFMGYKGTL